MVVSWQTTNTYSSDKFGSETLWTPPVVQDGGVTSHLLQVVSTENLRHYLSHDNLQLVS